MTKPLKNDENKPRFDLLPPGPLLDAAKVLTFGATKYADYNYLGLKEHRLIASLHRHLNADARGELLDEETGESHMAHALTNVLMIMHSREHRTKKAEAPPIPVGFGCFSISSSGHYSRCDNISLVEFDISHNTYATTWLWCSILSNDEVQIHKAVFTGPPIETIYATSPLESFVSMVSRIGVLRKQKINESSLKSAILRSCK